MCTGSHIARSSLTTFVQQILQVFLNPSSEQVVSQTYNNVISPSISASINGTTYTHENLFQYYESQRKEYKDFSLSFETTIDHQTDKNKDGLNRSGVVGGYATYTATKVGNGKKVTGQQILVAEVVAENEGTQPNQNDPRTVWKWDIVQHEVENDA